MTPHNPESETKTPQLLPPSLDSKAAVLQPIRQIACSASNTLSCMFANHKKKNHHDDSLCFTCRAVGSFATHIDCFLPPAANGGKSIDHSGDVRASPGCRRLSRGYQLVVEGCSTGFHL